jgi:hypothetical protein
MKFDERLNDYIPETAALHGAAAVAEIEFGAIGFNGTPTAVKYAKSGKVLITK